MEKKNVECKKHLRVVRVLKKSVGAIIITKCILKLGVNLTISELLASAPAIEKQLIKTIMKDKTVQFWVNTLGSSEAFEIKKLFIWYSIRSPKVKVRLEDGSKITKLLDTGAEINLMTRKIMENTRLIMRQEPQLELGLHTNYSQPLLAYVKMLRL